LAASRRTEEDLARLDGALEAMSGATDPRAAVDADLAFHRALLSATHNELLDRMQTVLESALAARDQLVHGTEDASDDPVPSHRGVLDAVRARDEDAAEAAMRALLDKAVSDEERVRPGSDRS
jgi:DNA-binding FadR family transcriptional regulator